MESSADGLIVLCTTRTRGTKGLTQRLEFDENKVSEWYPAVQGPEHLSRVTLHFVFIVNFSTADHALILYGVFGLFALFVSFFSRKR